MKTRPDNPQLNLGQAALSEPLQQMLQRYRQRRNFSVEKTLRLKRQAVTEYFADHRLDVGLVALSGGVDSALVATMLTDFLGSERVFAVTLPAHQTTSNQSQSVHRAQLVAELLGLDLHSIDISQLQAQAQSLVGSETALLPDEWAAGQFSSYLRTPILYYLTSLLSVSGKRAVVVGTTNRDEGDYLGYFGKASDGMVDLQLISDLHKSEVVKLAAHYQLPAEIVEAEPNGDMYDNAADVDVFGAPYQFVELYLDILSGERQQELNALDADSRKQFELLAANLERLHNYNKHKYLGKSPAVHLNVLPCGVEGGWHD